MPPTGDSSTLPPGTTSLLLRVNATDISAVRDWLQEWLRIYIFSAQGTVSVPLSMDTDGSRAFLYFYTSIGDVRGVLTLYAKREGPDETRGDQNGIMVRATSASRFVNPAGTFTATLPGERRIIRTLFADMDKAFPGLVQVVFKPPYIRLKLSGGIRSSVAGAVPITVFVGEIRRAQSVESVTAFLQAWGTQVQFRAGGGLGRSFFGDARLPPMSTEAMEEGLRIRIVDLETKPNRTGHPRRNTSELLVKVKGQARGKAYFKNLGPGRRTRSETENRDGMAKILVLASATHPDDIGTRAILQR